MRTVAKKKKKRVGGKTFPQNSNEAFHDYININIVLFFFGNKSKVYVIHSR